MLQVSVRGWQANRQNMVGGLHNYRQRYKQTHTHIYTIYIHESPRTISALRYMQIDAIETFAVQLVSHILVLNNDWKLAFNWKYTASGIVMNSSIASGALCEWKCLLLSFGTTATASPSPSSSPSPALPERWQSIINCSGLALLIPTEL